MTRSPEGVALPIARSCLLLLALLVVACGKKGPPLPPLVKLPTPPADLVAERRGDTVDLQFTVPAANTDNTRPANVERVDVYAITGPAALTDEDLIKHGTRIASVDVKAPRNPDQTIDEDEPAADAEPPEGKGLDQGAVARAQEELTEQATTPVTITDRKAKPADSETMDRPLLPASAAVPTRTYAVVGISTRGKRGPVSKRVGVPLVPPPPPPPSPIVTYDEKTITVRWPPALRLGAPDAASADDDASGLLPSRPIGVLQPTMAYNVYDAKTETRLTPKPIDAREYSDNRVVWGEERCYTVRAVETLGALTIESEAPAPTCTTLVDTFPPSPPANLKSAPSEGAISLIWDASPEPDVVGYLVYRGTAGAALQSITPSPIQEATFRDAVAAGVEYVYAVKAVDRAGNASDLSNRVTETAR